jgi:hypothetical protein
MYAIAHRQQLRLLLGAQGSFALRAQDDDWRRAQDDHWLRAQDDDQLDNSALGRRAYWTFVSDDPLNVPRSVTDDTNVQ